MFGPIIFIHILGSVILTIYLTFYWQRNFLERSSSALMKENNVSGTKVGNSGTTIMFNSIVLQESRRICKVFSGCVMGRQSSSKAPDTETLKEWCVLYNVSRCNGARRCCHDCRVFYMYQPSVHGLKPTDEQPHWMSIELLDMHMTRMYVASIAILTYVVLYATLALMRAKMRKVLSRGNSVSNLDALMPGAICIFIFAYIVSTTIYIDWYICVHFYFLLECQTSMFLLISWAWCLTLASMEFLLWFAPEIAKLFTVFRTLRRRATVDDEQENMIRWHNALNMKYKTTPPILLRCASNVLIKGIGGISIIWWPLIAVYLEGVHSGRWKL